MKEHYRFTVPISAIRVATLAHAKKAAAGPVLPVLKSRQAGEVFLAETDGSMIPTVTMATEAPDRRKTRKVIWKEAKVVLARPMGAAKSLYGATFGHARMAGVLWRKTAEAWGEPGYTHGLGDGAPWIVPQFNHHFGRRAFKHTGEYLVDFYHVYEKLGLVREAHRKDQRWLGRQLQRLKDNEAPKVLRSLKPLCEPAAKGDKAFARIAHRYILDRKDHLDYKGALEKGWPIGSGEVESAHGSVLQSRLKINGAKWSLPTAEAMAQLRVLRANDLWETFWNTNYGI